MDDNRDSRHAGDESPRTRQLADRGTPETVAVDAYLEQAIVRPDAQFAQVQRRAEEAGLPQIEVSSPMGKFLQLIADISGARRVLEVGTLAGYSTLWMARAVGPQGRIISCEYEPHHAQVAGQNLQEAGVADRVEIRVGDAETTLLALIEERPDPFDLVFLDADKAGNPRYLELALQMSRPGTVIIGDNVVRGGEVLDADSADPDIQGIRQFLTMQGEHPQLAATALQTVGSKSWDGFSLAVVREG